VIRRNPRGITDFFLAEITHIDFCCALACVVAARLRTVSRLAFSARQASFAWSVLLLDVALPCDSQAAAVLIVHGRWLLLWSTDYS
jgi:hypothetical protein